MHSWLVLRFSRPHINNALVSIIKIYKWFQESNVSDKAFDWGSNIHNQISPGVTAATY